MRYRVKGVEVRSENAAKPMSQPSRGLLKWISACARGPDILDYGCGKLRYADPLASRCDRLTLVDSQVQISRTQRIGDETTTVHDYASARWDHARVLSVREFQRDRRKYDFVLCANVLSAIPNAKVRAGVIRLLANRLKGNGRCLFVAQFRNSYFKQLKQNPRSEDHLDGYLLRKGSQSSYYGILDPFRLTRVVRRFGHKVVKSWVDGESAYVLTER